MRRSGERLCRDDRSDNAASPRRKRPLCFTVRQAFVPRFSLDIEPAYLHINGDMKKSDALAALAALAQETRLDIYRLLVQAGEAGLAAGKIGEELGLPSATLAFHL